MLDTSTGVWVDTSNEVMRRSLHAAASVGSRIYVYGGIREGNYFDTSKEVMRRSLHAAASVGSRIYVYGGIREGNYFDFFRIYLSTGNFAAFIFFTIFLCRCITRRFTNLWRTFKFWTNSPILFVEVIYLNFLHPFSLCII